MTRLKAGCSWLMAATKEGLGCRTGREESRWTGRLMGGLSKERVWGKTIRHAEQRARATRHIADIAA
jgi:hypothetical protein